MSGGVFINYRGEDSGSYGALLYMELSRRFGAELVFMDSESIPAGSDFITQLLDRVRRCRVLLAVVGSRWLSATGMAGERRIEDSSDWIRRELVEAFTVGVTVIPVLTDGAELPIEAELPADIAALARCQYRRLRHRDATADLGRICTDVAAVDPDLALAARRRSEIPHQLPADVPAFTGHALELADLNRILPSTTEPPDTPAQSSDQPTAMVISAVPGIQFDVAERARRYQTLLSSRRMLVVLDSASSVEQVRSLLPGSPSMPYRRACSCCGGPVLGWALMAVTGCDHAVVVVSGCGDVRRAPGRR